MKPPRPDDFDDYWYQDDDGNWKNEYNDMGYEFAEDDEFYSEEELKKAEEDLKKGQGTTVAATVTVNGVANNHVGPTAKTENSMVASLKDQKGTGSSSGKPGVKPADYEDGWYQVIL